MKAYVPRGMKFPIVTESNRSVKSWSQLVAEGASIALGMSDAPTLILGPVDVGLLFALPRPKSIGRKATAHTKKPDLDKLTRAVLDALAGVVFRDDSQVVDLLCSKVYAAPDSPPYVDVVIDETRVGQGSLFAEGRAHV